jgi:hypothetical protein
LKYYYLKCTNFLDRKEKGDNMKKGKGGMGCEDGR